MVTPRPAIWKDDAMTIRFDDRVAIATSPYRRERKKAKLLATGLTKRSWR
jgi:hypothetical protein